MVGKLIKHEFRATARIMLLVYAALAAAAVLANLSIRLMDVTDNVFLHALFGLVLALAVIGVVASVVITAVVMIGRFYRSLLKEQGYLMHTLPVTAHGHIWSKLIVSLVWFAATFVLLWLLLLVTLLLQSGTGLGELLADLPSWGELAQALREHEVGLGSVALFGAEAIAGAILSCLILCLHFYAAMALGHMFSKHQILLSIVFFIGINIVFNIANTSGAVVMLQNPSVFHTAIEAESASELLRAMDQLGGQLLLMELVQGAILYVAAWLPLKKGLNLA